MEEQLGMHKILWKNAGWGEHHVQNMILYNNQQICEGIRTKLNQKKTFEIWQSRWEFRDQLNNSSRVANPTTKVTKPLPKEGNFE